VGVRFVNDGAKEREWGEGEEEEEEEEEESLLRMWWSGLGSDIPRSWIFLPPPTSSSSS
jgi:hypothetical protein